MACVMKMEMANVISWGCSTTQSSAISHLLLMGTLFTPTKWSLPPVQGTSKPCSRTTSRRKNNRWSTLQMCPTTLSCSCLSIFTVMRDRDSSHSRLSQSTFTICYHWLTDSVWVPSKRSVNIFSPNALRLKMCARSSSMQIPLTVRGWKNRVCCSQRRTTMM